MIVLLGRLAVRRSSTHGRRVIGAIVGCRGRRLLRLGCRQDRHPRHWTCFDTVVARLWEFGVVPWPSAQGDRRIRSLPSPSCPGVGSGLIAASLFLIGENSREFPVPWALLPVAGRRW